MWGLLVTLELKARFEMILDKGIAAIARGKTAAQKCTQIALGDFVFHDSRIELGIELVLGHLGLAIERGILLLTAVVGAAKVGKVVVTAIGIEPLGGTSSLFDSIRSGVESGELALEDGFLAGEWDVLASEIQSSACRGMIHLIQDGIVASYECGLGFEIDAE